jgi:hypothetical protein
MLAYVFWHWPGPTVTLEVYTDLLIAFHQALAKHPPPGFIRSAVYSSGPAPWISAPEGGFQDWYLLADGAALDPLNAGTQAPGCRAAHDAVARQAAGGTAGLYRPWVGPEDLDSTARMAQWFAKPAGMTYDELSDLLRTVRPPGACWLRQMVLGPTPEFCWLGPSLLALPAVQSTLTVPLTALWPPEWSLQ